MTRRAITIRVDPATVEALDAYAAAHGLPGRGRALDAIMAPEPDEDTALSAWYDHLAKWGHKPWPAEWCETPEWLPTWVARGWVETEPDGRLVRCTVAGQQRRCIVPTADAQR